MIPKTKNSKFPKRLSVDINLTTQNSFFNKIKRESLIVAGEYNPLPPIMSQSNLSLDDGRQSLDYKKIS